MIQAYRYALAPTQAQERALRSNCGAARFAFNWGLALVKANLGQRAAERSYGIAEELLTPAVAWNLYSLRRRWNRAKAEVAPWWGECSKEAFNTGLANLVAALRNWSASRDGTRKGTRVGFPRLKVRHRSRPSCRFTTGVIRVEPDRRHVTLPRLGTIKTCESTRKLARHLERGTGRILAAAAVFEAGRWHVSLNVQVERAERVPAKPDAVVGVDVGVKALAVLSTGETVPNPQHLRVAMRTLRRRSRVLARRQGPRTSAGGHREPSKRWRTARAALARTHARIAAQRRDGLHQFTIRLVRTYGTVVAEDLNVVGMLGNRRLARSIADAGMGELRRQLIYKTAWNGGVLVLADRWFPSSKTCSGCGAVKAKLALRVRIFHCETCGLTLDRDLNAAHNLAALAAKIDVAQSCGETQNARGADVRPTPGERSALKREPRKRGTSDRKVTAA
ncbi:IS607 family element RNA-guided endonuclease TnpB [Nonomuraea sediminis]|uniref:IS607 family element RNA-guided endonuclease TnpB n=1 Tax=Nonomuraea sediminis TaxID=2835864 RepID=UPI001BDBE54A|nr:IS607 family element RNA-guided endonuclease TnpB [Nonomuraea sediminis]